MNDPKNRWLPKSFSHKAEWQELWRKLGQRPSFPLDGDKPLQTLLPQADSTDTTLIHNYVTAVGGIERAIHPLKAKTSRYDDRCFADRHIEYLHDDIILLMQNERLRSLIANDFETIGTTLADSGAPYAAAITAVAIRDAGTAIGFRPDRKTMLALNQAVIDYTPESRDGYSDGGGWHNGRQLNSFIASHVSLLEMTLTSPEMELSEEEQRELIEPYRRTLSWQEWLEIAEPHFAALSPPNYRDLRPVLADIVIWSLEDELFRENDAQVGLEYLCSAIDKLPGCEDRLEHYFFELADIAMNRGQTYTVIECLDEILDRNPAKLQDTFFSNFLLERFKKEEMPRADFLAKAMQHKHLKSAVIDIVNWVFDNKGVYYAEDAMKLAVTYAPDLMTRANYETYMAWAAGKEVDTADITREAAMHEHLVPESGPLLPFLSLPRARVKPALKR